MRTTIRFIDSGDYGEPFYSTVDSYEKATFRKGILNYTDARNKTTDNGIINGGFHHGTNVPIARKEYNATCNPGTAMKKIHYPGNAPTMDGLETEVKSQQDSSPDLSRQPPPRSHARGIISRYEMDRLDGINVKRVLEINPMFYSQQYCPGEKYEIFPTVHCSENSNPTLAKQGVVDTQTNVRTENSGKEKPRKKSLKKRINNAIRRLMCSTSYQQRYSL